MAGPILNVLIDLPPTQAYRVATFDALGHASAALGAEVDVRTVATSQIDDALIENPGHGVVVGPGSPYVNPDAVNAVIQSARERGVPLVGT
jgi:CTP synthase (UTP-ammonia lyase)